MFKRLFLFLSTLPLLWPLVPAQAAMDNVLLKSNDNSAVYYVMDGKRYAFPNEKVFFGWYDNFNNITTVSPSELASYPLAGNVTYRPGKWLVKIQTDPKVYAVSRYGVLHWITSEDIAKTLYGPNWNTKVQDIPDTFFTNYELGAPISEKEAFLPEAELGITQIAQNVHGVAQKKSLASLEALEQTTFTLVNNYRITKNLSPLVWNDALATVARAHSQQMGRGTVPMGHAGFEDRVAVIQKTMAVRAIAENVAYTVGYENPADVAVQGWLQSPGHLANIENSQYTQTGIGITINEEGSYFFTQIFIQ
jgi:uncharacterized protein YkwD